MPINIRAAPARASLLLTLNAAVVRGLPTAAKCLATVCVAALMCEAPAYAQSTITASFTRGAIAEYTNNPNGTDRGVLFSTLNITNISISQSSSNGQWGGSQGNDTAVVATITFTNGTTQTFPAAINWVKNAGGGAFDWVGLTIGSGVTVNDGYTPTAGFSKTYILQFPQSSFSLSSALPNGLDGSANTGAALNALNQYFPNATAPVITGPSGGPGSSASAISVNENQTAVTTLTADKAVTWALVGGVDQSRFQVSSTGVITFNAAPDFEVPTDADTNNTYLLTVRATDANGNTSTQTITVTVLNLDDTAPVVTAGQSFAYAENQAANATVGTVAATDAVGVTGFRFAATGTATSADTYYTIDAAGVIRLTAAGAAAGAPTNDFETAPNSFTYGIEARDAVGNWSAAQNVTLAVTDVNDVAPVITGPGGSTGSSSSVSVPEGTTNVATLTSNVQVSSWAIVGGNDQGRFTISSSGQISFTASPDFEVPTDSDANNIYLLTAQVTDANGNTALQTVSVTVTDVADTPPVITGPGGSTGSASAITVNEGTTAVTQLTANVPISNWAITGGNDSGQFAIDGNGAITFVAAPDFESPVDSDRNNVYLLTVTATDSNGQTSTQTVSVTVADLPDTPPVITGPGGSTGATSTINVPEGTSRVTALTANVPISRWSIVGGNDSGRFTIDGNGVVTFVTPPDFETPADSDTNNVYVLVIEATDSNGIRQTQTITVNVTDLADTPPVITGPGGATGTTSAITVNEGTTAVTQLTANVPINSWTITGGNDSGRFAIDGSGRVTFVSSPDYENPSDADGNNIYLLTITATDASGQSSTQTVVVTVADLADTPPVITGPGGSTGATSSISVPEGSGMVAALTANVPISAWAIVGGNDQGRFVLSSTGVLSFVSAPDFEQPADTDINNSYVLVIEGTDANGNRTRQTVTVNVTDIADTAPAITGPSGSAGAAASAITVNEGTTAVTQLAANVPVTWSIVGGNDRGQFAVGPTGAITFVAAPDFETPSDSDRNNTYVLTVQARDANGNMSTQTITVTVSNVDEIQKKLDQIGGNLRGDLRNQAFSSLSTMLAFNEGLLGLENSCPGTGGRKPVSGAVNANEHQQEAGVRFARDLSACESKTRVFVDGGVGVSRVDDNWTTRGVASARIEQRIGARSVIGAALIGTTANDHLGAFENSRIADQSLQLNVYGRTRLSDTLRFAAFAGWGRAWYSFNLSDDGFDLDGKMKGKRHLYGAALSGDIDLAGLTVTIDGIVSRAVEHLGSANLDASIGGESRTDMLFALGKVDITRLSVPVHVPFVFNLPEDGREATRLDISPGILCQDTSQDSSAIECGYQLGAKFRIAPSLRSILRAEARVEYVDGYLLNLFTVGFERRLFKGRPLALGVDLSRAAGAPQADNRVMVRFGIRP